MSLADSAARRLGTIDGLRGVAALSVAWFHFTCGGGLLADGWLKSSGRYGWLGVEMFFVISGFIIPYSLYRANYRSRDFGVFLVKRVARLDPPYFTNILLIIILGYVVPLVPGFRGEYPHYTWSQLACHLGYINSIVGKPWVNPVFWSLGIEFQYYLTIGIVFPLLIVPRNLLRFGFLAALLGSSFFFVRSGLVFEWWPLFIAGIFIFQSKVGLISTKMLLVALAVTGVVSWRVNGFSIAVIAIGTALIIRFVHLRPSRLTDLGLISYSLYLLHVPIGGKIVNVGARFGCSLPMQVLVLDAAVAASVGTAALFYLFIELPSQRLSSRLQYNNRCRVKLARAAIGAVVVHGD